MDLRQIAESLVRSDFDVARIVYGLVSTGVVELRVPGRASRRTQATRVATPTLAMRVVPSEPALDTAPTAAQLDDMARGLEAVRTGDFDNAVKAWAQFLQTHPYHDHATQIRAGLDAALKLRAMLEAS